MGRLEVTVRKPGDDRGRTVVLGRFATMLVSIVVMLLAIVMVTTAIVFGYLVIGLAFTALLIGLVVAFVRGAFLSFRR